MVLETEQMDYTKDHHPGCRARWSSWPWKLTIILDSAEIGVSAAGDLQSPCGLKSPPRDDETTERAGKPEESPVSV